MSPISRRANNAIQRVADLIDTSNWTWKHEVVRETFIAPDAEAILNIPIRQGGMITLLGHSKDQATTL